MWFLISFLSFLFALCLSALYVRCERKFKCLNDRLNSLWPSVEEIDMIKNQEKASLDRMEIVAETCNRLSAELADLKSPKIDMKKPKKKGK